MSLTALLMGACASESGLAIKDAANAQDAALTYFLGRESQNATGASISWQEEDVTPKDEAGYSVPEQYTKNLAPMSGQSKCPTQYYLQSVSCMRLWYPASSFVGTGRVVSRLMGA